MFEFNLSPNLLKYREASFRMNEWPLQKSSSKQLIDADFAYDSEPDHADQTHCLTCHVDVFDWDDDDDDETPYETHLRLSPDCIWLKEHPEEHARKHRCRRCPAKFASNTKLHAHIQEHHARKTAENTSGTSVNIDTPPTLLPPIKWSLSAITSIDTPLASPAKAPPLSICAIACIETTPAKQPPLPKVAPQAPPAPLAPLTPSSTPLLTKTNVASKASPAPPVKAAPRTPPTSPPTSSPTWANIASRAPLTPPPTPPQKTIKSYLTMDDLFRMFNTRKQPHQKSITAYFKPLGIDQRKRVPATKMNAPSQLSPTLQTRQMAMRPINNYRMHRFARPDAEKISFRFASKTTSGKTSEKPISHRHAAPPTWTLIDRRHRSNHTKTMAPYRRRLGSLLS